MGNIIALKGEPVQSRSPLQRIPCIIKTPNKTTTPRRTIAKFKIGSVGVPPAPGLADVSSAYFYYLISKSKNFSLMRTPCRLEACGPMWTSQGSCWYPGIFFSQTLTQKQIFLKLMVHRVIDFKPARSRQDVGGPG